MPFTPIQTLVGASMMGTSAYHTLVLNGGVLGVSGFAHRSISWAGHKIHSVWDTQNSFDPREKPIESPDPDHLALLSVAGLIVGGATFGPSSRTFETELQARLVDVYHATALSVIQGVGLIISGFLVGLGSKLSNGCTSGHMLCGVSRLAPRSLTATMVFFPTAILTRLLLGNLALFSFDLTHEQPVGQPSWFTLILLQIPVLLYRYGAAFLKGLADERSARRFVAFTTSFHFALGLTLTGMLRPSKVLGFLDLTPAAIQSGSWDPSLSLVIVSGILPQMLVWLTTLGEYVRQSGTRPAFATQWSVPMSGWDGITTRLVVGATLFGIGWGMSGICPGSATVLLGATSGADVRVQVWQRIGVWTFSFILGGLVGRLWEDK